VAGFEAPIDSGKAAPRKSIKGRFHFVIRYRLVGAFRRVGFSATFDRGSSWLFVTSVQFQHFERLADRPFELIEGYLGGLLPGGMSRQPLLIGKVLQEFS
jgi:hypothetical protein